MKYTNLASSELLDKTIQSLTANGFKVLVAETEDEAKSLALNAIPKGSRVMENTSKTLGELGITEEIKNSKDYVSLHSHLLSMDRSEEGALKRQKEIRSVPQVAVGSVHAVTSDGHLMLASGSGSQIPGYAYGADQVVIIAGTHKIVDDVSQGLKRIYEHSHPLEDQRMKDAGYDGSNVRRILIINSESAPRTTVILIKKVIGF